MSFAEITAYQKSVLSGRMVQLSCPYHTQSLVGIAWEKWDLGRNAAVHSEGTVSRGC